MRETKTSSDADPLQALKLTWLGALAERDLSTTGEKERWNVSWLSSSSWLRATKVWWLNFSVQTQSEGNLLIGRACSHTTTEWSLQHDSRNGWNSFSQTNRSTQLLRLCMNILYLLFCTMDRKKTEENFFLPSPVDCMTTALSAWAETSMLMASGDGLCLCVLDTPRKLIQHFSSEIFSKFPLRVKWREGVQLRKFLISRAVHAHSTVSAVLPYSRNADNFSLYLHIKLDIFYLVRTLNYIYFEKEQEIWYYFIFRQMLTAPVRAVLRKVESWERSNICTFYK